MRHVSSFRDGPKDQTRNLEIPGSTLRVALPSSRGQLFHLSIEIRFSLEPDARQVRHGDVTVLDTNAVGETAIRLEQIGIALIAAEPEAGGNIQGHLMSAMRSASARRPAAGLQHTKGALILA